MNTARALLVVLAILNAGCFEAEQPLGPPGTVPLDDALLGTWECRPPESSTSADEDDRATLTILRFDDAQYYAEWREAAAGSPGGTKVDRYRAYPTRVGGQTLLNTRDLDRDGWVFTRYAFDKEQRLRLSIVDAEAVGTKDSAAGLAVIRRRATDDALYSGFALCSRSAR